MHDEGEKDKGRNYTRKDFFLGSEQFIIHYFHILVISLTSKTKSKLCKD